MNLLLDTHIFLWFISGDARLPAKLRQAICDPHNHPYLSVVSFWEILIKHQLGKLPLPHPPASYIPAQRRQHQIHELPLDGASVGQLAQLPQIHRDPFDRMLVCQTLQTGMVLATVDPVIQQYSVTVFQ